MSQSETNPAVMEPPAAAPAGEDYTPRVLYSCRSISGKRESNQDVALIAQIVSQDGAPVTAAVACDGMGGHKAGEQASHLAAHDSLAMLMSKLLGCPLEDLDRELPALLLEAFQSANIAVMTDAAKNPACRDMGTTMVMAVLVGTTLYVANVGDSRAYQYHEETLEPLTRDDSFVRLLIDLGQISAEEAENHPRANEIIRCIGSVDALDDFGVTIHSLEAGDCIILCSDGLWKYGEEDIPATCSWLSAQPFTPASLNQATKNLTDQALARGSDDNISVVLIWLEPTSTEPLYEVSDNSDPTSLKEN